MSLLSHLGFQSINKRWVQRRGRSQCKKQKRTILQRSPVRRRWSGRQRHQCSIVHASGALSAHKHSSRANHFTDDMAKAIHISNQFIVLNVRLTAYIKQHEECLWFSNMICTIWKRIMLCLKRYLSLVVFTLLNNIICYRISQPFTHTKKK